MSSIDGQAGTMVLGRGAELEAAADWVAVMLGGRPGVLAVVGEAGIGKTTLVDEVARSCARDGARILRGASDVTDPSAGALWRGPRVQLRLGVTGGDITGTDRRWEMLAELANALAAAAPAVVVLEDVHWSDQESRWMLERLPGALVDAAVAIVVTSREKSLGGVRADAIIELGGLDLRAIAAFAAMVRPGAAIDHAALLARTGGNPLFVREVLRASAGDVVVPRAISDLFKASLDGLSATARRVVFAFALAGSETPLPVIASAVDVDVVAVRAALDEAVEAGMIVDDLGHLRFAHALLSEAVAGGATASERREVHGQLAVGWRRAERSLRADLRGARHGISAVPDVDPETAVAGAQAVAAAAVAAGDQASAIVLLEAAVAVLDRFVPDRRALLVGVLLDLGDVQAAVGANAEAIESFERAAVGSGVVSAAVAARAEWSAARLQLLHIDDPLRIARLERAERGLPAGDDMWRVRLLGRQAVAATGRAGRRDRGVALADEAVAMAGRLADPQLIAEALVDRFVLVETLDDLAAREAAAARLVDIGERTGRHNLVLTGTEWAYSAMMRHADRLGALDALDRMQAVAAIMPSPEARHGVLLRRCVQAALDGEIELATQVAAAAGQVGRQVRAEPEASGLVSAMLSVISRINGVVVDGLEATHLIVDESLARMPSLPFHDVHLAATEMILGRTESASRRVTRRAAEAAAGLLAGQAPATVVLLGGLVAELGLAEHAATMLSLIEPFAGSYTVELGFAADFPIDSTLGRLAMLTGDRMTAAEHLRRAARIAAALRSPPLSAVCARWLAEAVDADRASTRSAPTASLVHVGDTWTIVSPHGNGTVADSLGIGQLAAILAVAPNSIGAAQLSAGGRAGDLPEQRDLGPMLDVAAKRAYRRRIEELRVELDRADSANDVSRSGTAHAELEALMGELKRAVGLGGRDRPNLSGDERARVNVTRSVRRAIDAIASAIPALGAHLRVSIRTGRMCRYEPDPASACRWSISR